MKNTLPLCLVIIVRAKSQTFYRHFKCHSGKVTGGFKHINHGCVQEHSETLVTLQFDAGASALPTVASCSFPQNVTTPSFYYHEFYSGFFRAHFMKCRCFSLGLKIISRQNYKEITILGMFGDFGSRPWWKREYDLLSWLHRCQGTFWFSIIYFFYLAFFCAWCTALFPFSELAALWLTWKQADQGFLVPIASHQSPNKQTICENELAFV